MQRLTTRQLECVAILAELRNFRRAAERIGLTQPALSWQIRAVEETLGVQLFERDRRAVLVTTIGQEVAARCADALRAIDGVADAARGSAEPLVGTLTVGVIPTVAPYWLPALLPAVRKRFAKLDIVLQEVQTPTLLSRMHQGTIDVGIMALPVAGDFATQALVEEPFVLALPKGHTLSKRTSIRETDLSGLDLLLLEDGHCLRDQALEVCHLRTARELPNVRATSMTTLIQMVAGGMGATLLPAAAQKSASRDVDVRPFAGKAPGRTLGLAWRMSSARLREFRLLVEVMRPAAQALLG